MTTKLTTVVLLVASLASVRSAHAQLEFGTSVYVGSPYAWRGEVLSTGWVFQPSITAAYGGLSISYFGNIDPGSMWLSDRKLHLQESDLILAFNGEMSAVSYGMGYTVYTFPTPEEGGIALYATQEFFASAGVEVGPLRPSLFVAYDFDVNDENALEGVYGEARLAYSANAGDQDYSVGAILGLDNGYVLPDGSTAISHVALTGGTTFAAGSVSLAPVLGFQLSLDDTYKANYGETFFYGGFTIAF